ncbi:Sporulation protein YtxC [Thermaerobacter marianensis DSM 12885]|uniref:Sporulation protein YtxC n=1 Tax=Thermaerobacter marianensis (strain ATCC 700841 / DSM 12885 / JCM 10246 / 7p75a) TaxID=644966 RepID=E6SIN1_THEM7|nr:Sporulation protein YtxC [Thermaerobacter marianensis DSM 12885]
MLDLLVIGTTHPPDSLRQRLEQELAAFVPLAAACGLPLPQLTERQRGPWFFLAVQGPAPPGRHSTTRGRGGVQRPAGPGVAGPAGFGGLPGLGGAPWWPGLAGVGLPGGRPVGRGAGVPSGAPRGVPGKTDASRPDAAGAQKAGPSIPPTGRSGSRAAGAGLDAGGTGAGLPGAGPAALWDGTPGRGPQDAPAGRKARPATGAAGSPGRPEVDPAATAAGPGREAAGTPAGPGGPPGTAPADPPDETAPLRRDWAARVVRAVVGYIHDEHRWHLMQRMLARRYAHLAPGERQQVLAYARRHLAAAPARDAQLRQLLSQRTAAYLEAAELLLVDGFLRFRCREYVEALEVAVDRAVDAYLLDREYRDFVGLLRQFVDLQVPRLDVVHVVVEPSGRFAMTDEAGQPVPLPPGEGGAAGPGAGVAADPGDALLSALVTVGAHRFVVHLRRRAQGLPPDTREMLEQVFGDRVQLCPGCARCRPRARRREAPAPRAP